MLSSNDGGRRSAPRGLTIRHRQTLERLLDGRSEKEAASALGISRHTLHVYVKTIYRHYHVHTRSELLARFIAPAARRVQI